MASEDIQVTRRDFQAGDREVRSGPRMLVFVYRTRQPTLGTAELPNSRRRRLGELEYAFPNNSAQRPCPRHRHLEHSRIL